MTLDLLPMFAKLLGHIYEVQIYTELYLCVCCKTPKLYNFYAWALMVSKGFSI